MEGKIKVTLDVIDELNRVNGSGEFEEPKKVCNLVLRFQRRAFGRTSRNRKDTAR